MALYRDEAVVVRTYRLGEADRIVVLKEGQIVESGTHEELLARNAHYARFYQLQSGRPTAEHSNS